MTEKQAKRIFQNQMFCFFYFVQSFIFFSTLSKYEKYGKDLN